MVLTSAEEKAFFLKDEEPHLKQTIFPPRDRSETMEELPHLRQTILLLILK